MRLEKAENHRVPKSKVFVVVFGFRAVETGCTPAQQTLWTNEMESKRLGPLRELVPGVP